MSTRRFVHINTHCKKLDISKKYVWISRCVDHCERGISVLIVKVFEDYCIAEVVGSRSVCKSCSSRCFNIKTRVVNNDQLYKIIKN